MLAVFGAGLWAILSFGAVWLQAPTDLAGKWELSEFSSVPGPTRAMNIEQSGRYFRIALDGKAVPLKLIGEPVTENPTAPNQVVISLEGVDAKLEFKGLPNAEEYQLTITGGAILAGKWRAVRVAPLYPKRKPDQPTSRPAATTAPNS